MSLRTRMKPVLFTLIAVIALVATFVFGFGTAHVQPAEAAPAQSPLLTLMPEDFMQGKADAPVTIIEYSSMSCPHCAVFHKGLFQDIKKKYIDTGIVKFANRHFPLNEPALRAGMVTQCAGKERGITFTNVLFEMQDKWAFSADFRDNLKKIAAVGGMNEETFEACMNNKDLENSLLEARKEASEQLKVQATPTFFINGTEVKGNVTIEMFDQAIAAAQAAAKAQ